MSKKNKAQSTAYVDVWLRSLAVRNESQPWHLDVIEQQFVHGEIRLMREDFVARHSGCSHSGVPESDRKRIIARALEILAEHGRHPRVSAFWYSH